MFVATPFVIRRFVEGQKTQEELRQGRAANTSKKPRKELDYFCNSEPRQ